MESKWYAIYTRSRWERKIADRLSTLDIVNYCPLNKVERKWSDRKKIVEEPLFTSYVFVKVTDVQKNIVRAVYGVVNFVHWLGKPAVIPDVEIESIKNFLRDHYYVKLERMPLQVHDQIKITDGLFTEMEGSIVAFNKKSVKVLLPSLRFIMTAEIERENIEVIRKYNSRNG